MFFSLCFEPLPRQNFWLFFAAGVLFWRGIFSCTSTDVSWKKKENLSSLGFLLLQCTDNVFTACTSACDKRFTPWPLPASVRPPVCSSKKTKKTCAIHTRGGRQKKRHILSILHTPPSCCFSSLSAPPDAFSHLLHMRWELRTRRRLSVVNCLWRMRLILSFFLFLFVSEQHSAFFLGVSLWSVL